MDQLNFFCDNKPGLHTFKETQQNNCSGTDIALSSIYRIPNKAISSTESTFIIIVIIGKAWHIQRLTTAAVLKMHHS